MCACVCCEEGKRYESLNEYMNNLLHVCTFDKRVFGEKLAVFFLFSVQFASQEVAAGR